MPTPSKKRLQEAFRLEPSQALELKEVLRSADFFGRGGRDVEEALQEANKIIDGFGVETVGGGDDYGFWGGARAAYINTGDTYSPTILYDVDKERFYLTTLGDWVEGEERAGRYVPNQKMVSLDYGKLPTKKAFMRAYHRELGKDGEYNMKLGASDSEAAEGTVFIEAAGVPASFDEDEVWTGIKQLKRKWDQGDDEAGDLASSILYTLNFEWI